MKMAPAARHQGRNPGAAGGAKWLNAAIADASHATTTAHGTHADEPRDRPVSTGGYEVFIDQCIGPRGEK